jgi:hypothetical protein
MKALTTSVLLFTTLFTSIDLGAQVKVGKYKEPSIQVSNDEGESLITWTTNKEVNTSYFLVEISTDSIHFTTVKTLPAAGNSLFGITYEHAEISTNPEAYYRITLVDMNGARTSSQVVKNSAPITGIAGK